MIFCMMKSLISTGPERETKLEEIQLYSGWQRLCLISRDGKSSLVDRLSLLPLCMLVMCAQAHSCVCPDPVIHTSITKLQSCNFPGLESFKSSLTVLISKIGSALL